MRAVVGWQSSALFLCPVFLYGKIEIGGGIGFVAQCEMPPFALNGLESVLYHNVTEQQAVLLLCGCDTVADGMGYSSEVVKHATHVNVLACFEVH